MPMCCNQKMRVIRSSVNDGFTDRRSVCHVCGTIEDTVEVNKHKFAQLVHLAKQAKAEGAVPLAAVPMARRALQAGPTPNAVQVSVSKPLGYGNPPKVKPDDNVCPFCHTIDAGKVTKTGKQIEETTGITYHMRDMKCRSCSNHFHVLTQWESPHKSFVHAKLPPHMRY